MHIPDGMLDTRTWAGAWVGAAGANAYAARWVRTRMDDGRVVLMAVLAALVFALQMLNFPVAAGTSGHFAGGAAAAIVLGPWPAVLVMSTVLGIQALVFADGGISAMGANIVNMGVIAPFLAWWVYGVVARTFKARGAKMAAAFAAAWLATEAAALATALEIWLSGRAPLGVLVASMGFWHALIGLGEGAITAGLLGYLLAVRPDLLAAEEAAAKPLSRLGLAAFAAAAVGAAALSFVASSRPDGLEYVAGRLGLTPADGAASLARSPLPGYVIPGVPNTTLAGVLAGIAGLALAAVAAAAAVRALRAGKSRSSG